MTAEQKSSIESASSQPMLAQGGGWPSEEALSEAIHDAEYGIGTFKLLYKHSIAREKARVRGHAVANLLEGSTPREWKIPEGMKLVPIEPWLPIETAPDDGTPFLATLPVYNTAGEFIHHDTHVIAVDEDTGDLVDDYGWGLGDYQFWMPLPSPPLHETAIPEQSACDHRSTEGGK
jgi:hypothetical protein